MPVSSTLCWAAGAAGAMVLVGATRARRSAATAGGRSRGPRAAVAGLLALVATAASVSGASASPPAGPTAAAAAATSWVARTPGVFGMGDSLFLQCGDTLGLGSRSLGMVGWWGGTTRDMRARMSSGDPNWPYLTERSHAEELSHFRNAGSWVIGLGTNDVGVLSVGEYRDNVNWFMQQAGGRPVQWFDIYHPAGGEKTRLFNGVLRDAAARWPNLRILGWQRHVTADPRILHRDGLHIGSNTGCTKGRFALIRNSVPPVLGHPTPNPGWTDAPVSIPSPNPVSVKYQQYGGRAGLLGAPTGGLDCNRKKGGCVQFFVHGAIAWSPATGARVVRRAVNDGWWWYADMGTVGYPLEDTVCGLRDGGCRQRFETGTFSWSSRTAAQWTITPIQGRYAATGAENGHLGYPTTETRCNSFTRGCHQHFQRGTVTWMWAAPGPTRVLVGPIQAAWVAMGGENGRLGYPTGERACGLARGGCRQQFQYGSSAWSSATGARAVFGAIRDRWHAAGAGNGAWGYPIGEERCGLTGGGCAQAFQRGAVYWSPASGVHGVSGRIHQAWAAAGAERGRYGYPIGERWLADGRMSQRFQGGTISLAP